MNFDIDLVNEIAANHVWHSNSSEWWGKTNQELVRQIEAAFSNDFATINLNPIGELTIKNTTFGTISSRHLFGLDELIIFGWYELNSRRYRKVLDLGANIGVHSIVMSKLGFSVTAYEPDPHHIEIFAKSMITNDCQNIELRPRAIGVQNGVFEFTRVLGNTTGSHLSGSKKGAYGDLEIIKVQVDAIQNVIDEGYDLIKMDVEGYEAKLIEALSPANFNQLEIMLEIGNSENAKTIFHQLSRLKVNAFSQKNGWKKVTFLDDLPKSHREGSVFISRSNLMSWTTN